MSIYPRFIFQRNPPQAAEALGCVSRSPHPFSVGSTLCKVRERTKVPALLHAPPHPWTSTDIRFRFQGNAKHP